MNSTEFDQDDSILSHTNETLPDKHIDGKESSKKRLRESGLRESAFLENTQVDDDNERKPDNTVFTLDVDEGPSSTQQQKKTVVIVDDDDEEEEDLIVEIGSKDKSKKIFRQRFLKTGKSGLSRFYRVKGGTVTSTYKIAGLKANGKEKLVRDGVQTWRDAKGRVLRTRHYVDGVCHGEEIIFCYVLKESIVAFVEPERKIWTEDGRSLVCKRNWNIGKLSGPSVQVEVLPVYRHCEFSGRYYVGKTETIVHYQNDLKNGTELRYYAADPKRILHQCDWVNGQKSGLEVANYSNGQKAIERVYVDGKSNPLMEKEFHRNGKLRSSTVVKDGVATRTEWSNKDLANRQISFTNSLLQQNSAAWFMQKTVKTGAETIIQKDGTGQVRYWRDNIRVHKDGSPFDWKKEQAVTSHANKRAKKNQ